MVKAVKKKVEKDKPKKLSPQSANRNGWQRKIEHDNLYLQKTRVNFMNYESLADDYDPTRVVTVDNVNKYERGFSTSFSLVSFLDANVKK